jgi:hypothetical protein
LHFKGGFVPLYLIYIALQKKHIGDFMALCVDSTLGVLSASTTQIETNCTTYLLMSADEYRFSRGFFSGVELADVIETSGAIVLCWAVAWGIKNSGRFL